MRHSPLAARMRCDCCWTHRMKMARRWAGCCHSQSVAKNVHILGLDVLKLVLMVGFCASISVQTFCILTLLVDGCS